MKKIKAIFPHITTWNGYATLHIPRYNCEGDHSGDDSHEMSLNQLVHLNRETAAAISALVTAHKTKS